MPVKYNKRLFVNYAYQHYVDAFRIYYTLNPRPSEQLHQPSDSQWLIPTWSNFELAS